MIDIEGLSHRYNTQLVLRNLHLHVTEGSFVTLVGGNGAGKTTLLRIMATLLRFDEGSVKIGGWPLPQDAMRVRRNIGLISHQTMLYDDLSAYENLLYYTRLYGLDADSADSALAHFGLTVRRNDPVSTFSRGMRQRLTIARALLHSPAILLLDEPFSGLDQEAIAALEADLAEQHQQGRTIVLVTHDIQRGLAQCDRCVVLADGQISADISREGRDSATMLDTYTALTSGAQQ